MHFIQFTTAYANRTDVNVQQYSADEMSECFAPHERVWLSEGKIVERGETSIVDLQAFFNRNSKVAK